MDGFTAGYFAGTVITCLISTWLFCTVFNRRLQRQRAELTGHIRAQQRAFLWALREMKAQQQGR